MEIFQAIVLGVVQGLTEFIPVSSSAHLVLVPYLSGWEPPGLAFDVALHMGTLVAVLAYFRRELVAMARGLTGRDRTRDGLVYRRVGLLLIVGSVPVALAGALAEDAIGRLFESPLVSSGLLLVTAALLIGGERWRDNRVARSARRTQPVAAGEAWNGDWVGGEAKPRAAASAGVLPIGVDPGDPSGTDLGRLSWQQAGIIGVAQCFALLPGISRSGATITAGLVSGLTRDAATRFSFLLSLPALVGAAVLKLPDLAIRGIYSGPAIAAGVIAAGIAGYLAIRFLVALVARDRLTGFARYCVVAAVVGVLGVLMLGPPSTV